jgi:WD40 repeat protein
MSLIGFKIPKFFFNLALLLSVGLLGFENKASAEPLLCHDILFLESNLIEIAKQLAGVQFSFLRDPVFHSDFSYQSQMVQKLNEDLAKLLKHGSQYLTVYHDEWNRLSQLHIYKNKVTQIPIKDKIDLPIREIISPHVLQIINEEKTVTSFEISPDNNFIVTAALDNRGFKVFDLKTGRQLYQVDQGHYVRNIKISADSKKIITQSEDDKILITDITTNQTLREITKSTWYNNFIIAPQVSLGTDSIDIDLSAEKPMNLFSVKTDDQIVLFQTGLKPEWHFRITDLQTLKKIRQYSGTGVLYTYDVNVDGSKLVISLKDGNISIIDLKTNKSIYQKKYNLTSPAAFTPDGKFLMITHEIDEDKQVILLIDPDTGKTHYTSEIFSGVLTVISQNSEFLLLGFTDKSFKNKINVVDTKRGNIIGTIDCEFKEISKIALSPDNRYVVYNDNFSKISVFDLYLQKSVFTHDFPDQSVSFDNHLEVNPNFNILALGQSNGNIEIRYLDSGELAFQVNSGSKIESLKFSADGRFLLVTDIKGSLTVIDLKYPQVTNIGIN